MTNTFSHQDQNHHRFNVFLDDDFSKVNQDLKTFSQNQLKKEIQLLLELIKRYSIELSYYQISSSQIPEKVSEIATKIDQATKPLTVKNIDEFIILFDLESIDFISQLFSEYDKKIQLQNNAILSLKSKVVFFNDRLRDLNKQFNDLSIENAKTHQKLIDIYKNGIFDESSQTFYFEIEKKAVKNFVKIIERENSEMIDQFSQMQQKLKAVESNLFCQTEIQKKSHFQLDEYLKTIEELNNEKIILDNKINQLINTNFDAKIENKLLKTELAKKEVEIETLKNISDQFKRKFDKIAIKLENSLNQTKQKEKVDKIDSKEIIFEVETLKTLNTDLEEKIKYLQAENFRMQKMSDEINTQNQSFLSIISELEVKLQNAEDIKTKLTENMMLYEQIDSNGLLKNGDLNEIRVKYQKEVEYLYFQKSSEISELTNSYQKKIDNLKNTLNREISSLKKAIQSIQTENSRLKLDLLQYTEIKTSDDHHEDIDKEIGKIIEKKDSIIEDLNQQIIQLNRAIITSKIVQIKQIDAKSE